MSFWFVWLFVRFSFSTNILKTMINRKKPLIAEMILMVSPTKVFLSQNYWTALCLIHCPWMAKFNQVSDSGFYEPLFMKWVFFGWNVFNTSRKPPKSYSIFSWRISYVDILYCLYRVKVRNISHHVSIVHFN